MKLITTNLCAATGTTVTASSEDANFPASNLQHPFRSKRLRTQTGTTSVRIVFDTQTTEAVDSIALFWPKEDGIKLSETATISVQANATNVWTSPALDQSLTINNIHMVASHFFSSDQNYRYWSIVISDSGNAYGYLELGVVYIGKSLDLEPAQNGFKFKIQDTSEVTRTPFGHRYIDEFPTFATLDFSYDLLDYSDLQLLDQAFRQNGTRVPVLVALDPTATVFDKDHFLIYGTFGDSFTSNHLIYDLINADTIRIEEIA